MLKRGKMDRDVVEIVGIDSLVPKKHLLRKIDKAVDFNRLYEMVEPLYCEDNGRPSIDPVVLFKMVLIQHLYGLPSLRRTAEEVSGSIYYRWFLGYTLQDETPHFSTVSYNFRHRFTEETVDQVFRWILEEVAEAGYLSPKAVFIDGTHIKANANTKKQVKAQVPAASKHYAKELMEEVNADREAQCAQEFVRQLEQRRKAVDFLPTVSFGSAPFLGEDVLAVKNRADREMYRYKKARKPDAAHCSPNHTLL